MRKLLPALGLVLLWMQVTECCVGAESTAPDAAAIDGMFAVRAGDEATAAALHEWMHGVAARLERRVGAEARFRPGESLRLAMVDAAPGESAGVSIREQWHAGLLQQSLLVRHSADLDQEDLLEAFCRLWLQRVLLTYVPAERRGEPLYPPPAWVTTGMAQALFPEQMGRNRLVLEEALASKRVDPAVGSILELQELPPGRGVLKSLTGLFWEWMSLQARPYGLDPLWRRLAAGQPLDEAGLAAWLGFESPAALSRDWEVWLYSRRQLIGDHRFRPGALRLPLLDDLERVPSELLSLASGTVIENDWSIADLLAAREEPWLPVLCQTMAWDLRLLSLGQPPEVTAVLERYAQFYTDLGKPPPLAAAARHRELAALRRAWQTARDARDRLLGADRPASIGPGCPHTALMPSAPPTLCPAVRRPPASGSASAGRCPR